MYITVCDLKILICSGSAFPFHLIILLNFLYHCPNNLRFDVSSESSVDNLKQALCFLIHYSRSGIVLGAVTATVSQDPPLTHPSCCLP